jgi:hypothetical protein
VIPLVFVWTINDALGALLVLVIGGIVLKADEWLRGGRARRRARRR